VVKTTSNTAQRDDHQTQNRAGKTSICWTNQPLPARKPTRYNPPLPLFQHRQSLPGPETAPLHPCTPAPFRQTTVQLPPTPPPRNISGTDASFAVAHGTNTVRRLRAIWARCRTYRPHSDSGLGRQGRKGGTNKRDVGRTDETKDSPRLGDLGVREGCPKRRLHAGCRPRGGEAVRGQPEWGV
jgi:hypothetical protein